jgi:PKD repeat protein
MRESQKKEGGMSGTQPLAGRVQRPRTAGFAKPTVRAFLWTVLVVIGLAFALQSVPASAQLTVNASGSPLSGVAPLTVNFSSTVAGGTLPYTWAWDFGDGGTAATQNPQYVYNAPGTYMVNLLVVDANGATGTATLGPIVVFLPVEVIANQTCGEAYLNVCFSANPGGTPPYSYTWDFGDGTFPTPNVNEPLPCHTFTTPNTYYLVTCHVVDFEGHTGVGAIEITTTPLTVTPCVTPTNGSAPLLVQFNSGCGFVSGGIPGYSYVWDFGDGSALCYDWATQHGYNDPGTYHVTLTVTDSCTPPTVVTDTHLVIRVLPGALAGTATVDKLCGPAGTTACFAGTAIGGTPPYTYSWNYGDGSPAQSGPTPCHVYAAAGNYTVAMTVTDAAAHTSVDSHIIVSITDPLSVVTSVSRTNGYAPFTAYFTSSVTGGTSPFTYLWDFGDGTTDTVVNPVHVFQPGYYNVKLTVTDSCTPSATASNSSINIIVYPVNVTASVNLPCGVAPLNVIFTGDAVGGKPPFTWAWDFGDGGTDTQQNPSHSYLAAGSYTAHVTATDSLGISGTTTVAVQALTALNVTVQGLPSTVGPPPLTVNVSSVVTGGLEPYTYDWDFADGSQHSQSPRDQHTWATPGIYNVTLTVTDSCGQSAVATLPINVIGPLTAPVVTADLPCGYIPLNVNFTGTAAGGLGPYTYAWTFGDGSSSALQNPSHGYVTEGNYVATLLVSDSLGHTSPPSTVNISVTKVLAVTSDAAPLTGPALLSVNFTSSVTGGTPPYTYSWDFGDGSTPSTTPAPMHIYNQVGVFPVALTVKDSCNHTLVDDHLIVTVTNPITLSIAAAPTTGTAPLTVNFSATFTGGEAPFSYDWDFGDGSSRSQLAAPQHVYATGGAYTAKLTLTDSHGLVQTATTGVTVYSPVVATPTVNLPCGYAPLNVIFTGNAAGGLPPYTYAWTFGDGGTDTLPNPSHSYLTVGDYTATVTVTDSLGHSGSGTVGVSVTAPLTVTAHGLPATSGPAPLTVNVSSTVSGGTPPYTYDWDFADGSQHSLSPADQHTWATPGTYDVVLTVKDSCGHQATSTLTLNVYGPVVATPTADVTCGYAPLNVVFTGAGAGGVPPYTYAWTFGDGGTSTLMNPSHSYLAVGGFTATLTVTDSLGHSGSSTVTVTTTAHMVVVIQGLPATTGPAPLTVNLASAVTGGTPAPPPALPYGYSWDFGDGSPAVLSRNAQHTWINPGTYDVVLTVTDSCSHTETATLTVNAYAPVVPTLGQSVSCGTAPLNVCFNPSATGGVPPYIYSWSFGDGTPVSSDQKPCHNFLSAGNFTVILTATDSVGNVGSANAVIQSVAILNLQAYASADATSGLMSLLVNFSSSVSGSPGPFTYSWDFGDGSPADTGSHPNHLYQTVGTYTVVLTVTAADACGKVYTATDSHLQITILPAPTITLDSPTAGSTYGAYVPFQSTVYDNVPVLRVVYYANGSPIGVATTAPYLFVWDTTGYSGSVSVYAMVADVLGRTAQTSPITISLDNPTVSGAQLAYSPLRIKVFGNGFMPGAVILINGQSAPLSEFKSTTMMVAKGEALLKAMLPKGVPVTVQVLNPTGGLSNGATIIR